MADQLASIEESPQFKMLSAEQQDAIMSDFLKNPTAEGGGPTLNMSRNGVPISGPIFKGGPSTGAVGPLTQSQVPPALVSQALPDVPTETPEQASAQAGALSQVPAPRNAPVDMAAMLKQFMPQDDSRSRYMALAAGFGSATKTGSLGEQIGNVASAMQQQKMEQEKIRSQYVPLIMQQVAGQQAREEQAQYRLEAQQQAQQAQAALAQQAQQSRNEQAEAARQTQLTIAAGNQQGRQQANQIARAHMITQALAQYPFGIPASVQATIDATAPADTGTGIQGVAPVQATPDPSLAQPTVPGQPPSQQPGAMVNPAPGGTNLMGPGSKGEGLSGDEFLATLPPTMAAEIKAMAEGRKPIPTGIAGNSPYGRGMMQALYQYDPSADTVNAAGRNAVYKDFTSGKSAQAITAFNTTMGHLGDLQEAAEKLNNTSGFPGSNLVNAGVNAWQSASGDPKLKVFNSAKDAVVGELVKAFNNGHISDSQLHEWGANLNSADSPEQMSAVIKQLTSLLGSKINALGEQYKQGMGGNVPTQIQLLTPHAQAAYNKILGVEQPKSASGWEDNTPLPEATPTGATDPRAAALAEIARRKGAQ